MEDHEIIDLYFQRSEDAISRTDEKYGQYCFTVANNILASRQDSEECVNDTYLRAWHAMPPQKPKVLRQFLAKITRNLSLDRWRAANSEKRGGGELTLALDELSHCVGGGVNPADELERKALQESLPKFLQLLSQRDRGIFLRRYFYVESIADIAQKYAMKEANVRLILSRTRQRLRDYLRMEGLIT